MEAKMLLTRSKLVKNSQVLSADYRALMQYRPNYFENFEYEPLHFLLFR